MTLNPIPPLFGFQVYNNLMSQLESRWATLEALQQSHDMSRANDESIMQSLKDTDKKFSDNLNIKEQVMIKVNTCTLSTWPDG